MRYFIHSSKTTILGLVFLFILSIAVCDVQAQTTINEDVFTQWVGKKYKEVMYETDLGIGDQLATILAAEGANQVWDFTGFNYIDSTVIIHEVMEVDASDPLLTSPYLEDADYLLSIRAIPGSGGVVDTTMTYLYTSLDADRWLVYGAYSLVDIDLDGVLDSVVQYFVPASLQVQFPVTSTSAWHDSTNLVNFFMGMELISATNIDSNWVLGFGTLITPYGEADALRVNRKEIAKNPFFPNEDVTNEVDFVIATDEFSANIIIEDERAFYSVRKEEGGPTSVETPAQMRFEVIDIYPNPANEYAILQVNLRESATIHYQLINSQGQSIGLRKNIGMDAGKNLVQLELQGLPNGQYFVRINSGRQYQIVPVYKF